MPLPTKMDLGSSTIRHPCQPDIHRKPGLHHHSSHQPRVPLCNNHMVHRQPTGLPHMGCHPTQPRGSYTPRRTGRYPPSLGTSHEAIPSRSNNASANAEATPTLTPPKHNTHPLPPTSSSLTPHTPHATLMSSTSEQAGQMCAATETYWSRQYIYCWPDEIKMPHLTPSPK